MVTVPGHTRVCWLSRLTSQTVDYCQVWNALLGAGSRGIQVPTYLLVMLCSNDPCVDDLILSPSPDE